MYFYGTLTDKAVLFKVNNKGELEWSKIFSDESDKKFYCVQLTYDGGLIIVGNKKPHGDYETSSVYIVKTDIDGNINSNTQ